MKYELLVRCMSKNYIIRESLIVINFFVSTFM
jgi:hypothetical protein